MLRLEVTSAEVQQFLTEQGPEHTFNAKFGTREPALCPDRKQPITEQTAIQYFACDTERIEAERIVLVSDVHLLFASGRPYKSPDDAASADIDVREQVFDLAGGYNKFTCSPRSPSQNAFARTHNCEKVANQPTAGHCSKNLAGDWHCRMSGFDFPVETDQLPPSGPVALVLKE